MHRSRFDQAIQLLTMRGVVVGTRRADDVFREVEKIDGLKWSDVFDKLRSKGASVPFSTERGVLATIAAHDTERAARNAREAEVLRRRQVAFDSATGPRSFTDTRRNTLGPLPRRFTR